MSKRGLLLIILLLCPLALAENESANVILTFVDAVSKEPIDDVFVETELNGQKASYFLEQDQTLKLKLAPNEYHLKILINDPATKGYDYYGETFLTIENSLVKVIYLYPVGSLDGFVKDQLDTVMAEADLNFDCNKIFNVDYPPQTDHFGSFSLDYVPIGNCKIYGSYENSLGVQEVEIKPGEKISVNIKLDTVLNPAQNQKNSVWKGAVLMIIIIITAMIVIYYFKKKKNRLDRKEKLAPVETKESANLGDLTKREKDIIKTLRENERKIVDFLLEQKAPVYFSKIHYQTGLSKSSLFRNLRSLERKNIVLTTKEGKIRKVRISDWFLGK